VPSIMLSVHHNRQRKYRMFRNRQSNIHRSALKIHLLSIANELSELKRSGIRLSSAKSGGPFDVLLKQDEVQIVAERPAEAFVTVGEGLSFPG
jgi:hypothetical protein